MGLVSADARWTNAAGDFALCVGHMCFLAKVVPRTVKSARAKELKAFVVAYFVFLAAFQGVGAWLHLTSPLQADMDLPWLAYLTVGCMSPCLYGAALSLDQLESRSARRLAAIAWCVAGAAYCYVTTLEIDLADHLPLPRSFEVVLPASVAFALRKCRWMGSALRANAETVAGAAPLTLKFDGRGYAATPFDSIFDDEYAHAKDLVAEFPSFRTESLGTLMLCFGVGANFVHFFICRSGAARDAGSARAQRAASCAKSHRGMCVALVTMPCAMLFGGVPCGIDWMHACAAPGMYLQAKACAEAVDAADKAKQR